MERYNSGSSLNRTKKEERVDYLEAMVGEFSDELFTDLKKLTVASLTELHRLIAERIADEPRREAERKKK